MGQHGSRVSPRTLGLAPLARVFPSETEQPDPLVATNPELAQRAKGRAVALTCQVR